MKLLKQKQLPVHYVCRNCNTPLHGRYCHTCGQDLFVGTKRSVLYIIFGFFNSILSTDHKLWKSVLYLLFKPGKLTREYTLGRVSSYVHPSKLFWCISIIFFTMLTTQINSIMEDVKKATTDVQKIDKKTSKAEEKLNETDIQKTDKENSNAEEKLNESIKDTEKFLGHFFSYSPYVMFLLMPFFAFLFKLFFYKRERYYINHLIFSIHYHSFVFLFYGIIMGLFLIFKEIPIPSTILLLLPFIYLFIATYVLYRPKIAEFIIKTILICGIYIVAIIVGLIFFLIFLYARTFSMSSWEAFRALLG